MPKRSPVPSKPSSKPSSSSYETATCRDFIEQADICCEQARSAALKKRFTAALGLFRTAQSLYNRAIAIGGEACAEARERLQNLSVEIASYAELARPRAMPQRVPVKVIAHSHDDMRL